MVVKTWVTDSGHNARINDQGRHLCGYVMVPVEHKFRETDYDEIPIKCHGGLTFSDGEWIGFDCAHIGDTKENCDIDFVTKECESIGRQLNEANTMDS